MANSGSGSGSGSSSGSGSRSGSRAARDRAPSTPPQRGGNARPPAPPPRSRWRWLVYLVFLLALLGINWWLADNALSPNKPSQVA
jgi:hypothetical protein